MSNSTNIDKQKENLICDFFHNLKDDFASYQDNKISKINFFFEKTRHLTKLQCAKIALHCVGLLAKYGSENIKLTSQQCEYLLRKWIDNSQTKQELVKGFLAKFNSMAKTLEYYCCENALNIINENAYYTPDVFAGYCCVNIANIVNPYSSNDDKLKCIKYLLNVIDDIVKQESLDQEESLVKQEPLNQEESLVKQEPLDQQVKVKKLSSIYADQCFYVVGYYTGVSEEVELLSEVFTTVDYAKKYIDCYCQNKFLKNKFVIFMLNFNDITNYIEVDYKSKSF